MKLVNQLKAFTFSELCSWLCDNFTQSRYRYGNSDVVEIACSMLYEHGQLNDIVTEFYSRLWGAHGELPDYLPNFDSYGRLTTWRPNYDKPGMKERVRQQAEAVEPKYSETVRIRMPPNEWFVRTYDMYRYASKYADRSS